MINKLKIAIDGPAGSGKSTSARLVAKKLNYIYIDTGAMYRAITFLAIKNKITEDTAKIVNLIKKTDIRLKLDEDLTRIYANGEELTANLRSRDVNEKVSDISIIKEVRDELVIKQREIGFRGGIVMEGRDIGTVVFPEADVKIFLTCSLEERAIRRAKEYELMGKIVSVEEIKENLNKRDNIDSNRQSSPLKKADDALEVDTSNITIDEQVKEILDIVAEVANMKGINLIFN